MEPTDELKDSIFWEKVDRAEELSPAERILAGPELFERAIALMEAGVRHDFPDANSQRVGQIVDERLKICRQPTLFTRPVFERVPNESR